MNIIVTGSLGHISKPLAKSLVQNGHSVTVITTDPGKQQAIEAFGATPAVGSVEDLPFLLQTLQQADAIYCMTPPDFAAPDQLAYYENTARIYTEAIRQSGVKRAVYLSSYGAHLPSGTGFITGSHRAELLFDALPGVSVTHMRPGYFYYNLLGFIHMIRTAGFIGSVYGGDDLLALVSPLDIAAAIANEIVRMESPRKIRYVVSDDRSCSEVATVLGHAIGKPDLQWRVLPEEQVRQSLLAAGIPNNAVENLLELGQATHSGILREEYEKQTHEPGTVKLEDFAKEFAIVYNNTINS
ncbi:NAD(P)H-binding protein [Nostoc ellipsosporum NOK]|nr:NAD(P)H-binding protein [Nostoc ellipsosporum NOK]